MKLLSLVGAGAGAVLVARLLGSWSLTLARAGVARVEDVVTLAACTLGALVALWYAVTALGLLLAELTAHVRQLRGLAALLLRGVQRLGAPVLRRAVVVGLGAGLTLGAAPALASDSTGPVLNDGAVPVDLRPGQSWSGATGVSSGAHGGSTMPTGGPTNGAAPSPVAVPTPFPDGPAPSSGVPTDSSESASEATAAPAPSRPSVTGTSPAEDVTGSTRARPSPLPEANTADAMRASPASPATSRPVARPEPGIHRPSAPVADEDAPTISTYVVQPGDTLWDIAAAHLGPDSALAAVADDWPRWHALNLAVIGDDPDLIRPGQTLLVPDPKD